MLTLSTPDATTGSTVTEFGTRVVEASVYMIHLSYMIYLQETLANPE
jgi:hypothetical protein